MWRRGGVQEPSPGEPRWPVYLLWIPPLPRLPWKTDQWDRIRTCEVESQWCPVMRGWTGGSIWWLTVSKAADRSSRMRIDDLELAFAIRRASVIESSAVSVEWPLLCVILRVIDSTRCWKHSSEILVHIDMIASHSCCRFAGCTSMMRISRFTTSQRCTIGLRSGDCGGHLSKVNSLSCSRNQSEMIWALCYGALSS